MFKRKPKKDKTRIVVQYDAGFANQVFLRGVGVPELNWGKGIPLKNTKPNEWVWETEASFTSGEFKVLINDQTFEVGENHHIYPGTSIRINPKF